MLPILERYEPPKRRLRIRSKKRLCVVLAILVCVVAILLIQRKASGQTKYEPYTVGYGDTYWSIARELQEDGYKPGEDIRAVVDEIIEESDIRPDELKDGDEIRIPRGFGRMARARNIKPGFFLNDELGELDPLARLLFAGLWCVADKEGRLEDRPKRIKIETLPYDDCDIDKLLDDLAESGFIVRYEVDETRYIQVENFRKHQNPHPKEAASVLPAPPENREEIKSNVKQCTSREKVVPSNGKEIKSPEKQVAKNADSLIPHPLSLNPHPLPPTPTDDDDDENKKPEKDLGTEKQPATPNEPDSGSDPYEFYSQNIRPMLPMVAELIKQYEQDLPPELLVQGMKIAVTQNVRKPRYFEKVWQNWINDGVKTMDDYKRVEAERQNKDSPRDGPKKKLDFGRFPQHDISEDQLNSLFEDIG